MTFTEDWYLPADCQALADLAARVSDVEGAVVEIGCWEGRSTIVLANAVAPDQVHAVDTWAGSPGEISRQLASERDVFAQFTANVAEATKGNVTVHRQDWRDWIDGWDRPIRLIHIDATHTYSEVVDNIEAVRPLMVAGGIICGDDAHHPPVRKAVMHTLGNANLAGAKLWYRAV